MGHWINIGRDQPKRMQQTQYTPPLMPDPLRHSRHERVGKMTPLYPTFVKRIRDGIDGLIWDKVTPWVFMTAGPPFKIRTFHGKEIAYQGIKFDGSPRRVFWGRFIEPFLEDLSINEINTAVKMANERRVNLRELLPEVRNLLGAGIERVYTQMADVDRRLRGEGLPQRVQLMPLDGLILSMMNFIDQRIQAEIAMWRPRPRWENFYEKNKLLIKFLAWAIPIIGTLIGILAKFFWHGRLTN